MQKIRNELLEFAERSERHGDLALLTQDFSDSIKRHGFGSFIVTGLPSIGLEVEPLIIANHWPAAWTDRYREQDYFADDPISKWSLTRCRPFAWSEAWAMHAPTPKVKQINGEAREHGLKEGIAFPMRSFSGLRTVLSVATPHELDTAPGAQELLYMAGIYFLLRASELNEPAPAQPKLTPREREILLWTAEGKSAWSISRILSIAEGTVRNHMDSIRRKLDAGNATQAVILALKSGQIQL